MIAKFPLIFFGLLHTEIFKKFIWTHTRNLNDMMKTNFTFILSPNNYVHKYTTLPMFWLMCVLFFLKKNLFWWRFCAYIMEIILYYLQIVFFKVFRWYLQYIINTRRRYYRVFCIYCETFYWWIVYRKIQVLELPMRIGEMGLRREFIKASCKKWRKALLFIFLPFYPFLEDFGYPIIQIRVAYSSLK